MATFEKLKAAVEKAREPFIVVQLDDFLPPPPPPQNASVTPVRRERTPTYQTGSLRAVIHGDILHFDRHMHGSHHPLPGVGTLGAHIS